MTEGRNARGHVTLKLPPEQVLYHILKHYWPKQVTWPSRQWLGKITLPLGEYLSLCDKVHVFIILLWGGVSILENDDC